MFSTLGNQMVVQITEMEKTGGKSSLYGKMSFRFPMRYLMEVLNGLRDTVWREL